MAAKNHPDSARSIASALAFVSYLVSNLSESELAEIKQILWIGKIQQVFIEISKNSEFKKRIFAIGKQYLHPMNFDAGQLPSHPAAVILYSKFCPARTGISKTIISWDAVKPESARVLLNKRLFGYAHHGIDYRGVLAKYSGEKLGKGCIAIPSQYSAVVLEIFRSMRIPVHVKEVAEVV